MTTPLSTTHVFSRKSLLVYFDILGFSEIVREASCSPRKGHGLFPTRTSEEICRLILQVWDWIHAKYEKTRVGKYLFSDCGFLVYPLGRLDSTMSAIASHLQDVRELLDQFLSKGFFLRGAMACGNVYHARGLLLGEAVIEAVRLEGMCPGPFIILPTKEIQMLGEAEPLLSTLGKYSVVPIRDGQGRLECLIQLPFDRREYGRRLSSYCNYYVKHGPSQYAKFYLEAKALLEQEELL